MFVVGLTVQTTKHQNLLTARRGGGTRLGVCSGPIMSLVEAIVFIIISRNVQIYQYIIIHPTFRILVQWMLGTVLCSHLENHKRSSAVFFPVKKRKREVGTVIVISVFIFQKM